MERKEFEEIIKRLSDRISAIRQEAHELHARVNQTYGKGLPYGFHLDMVADAVTKYGHAVCVSAEDVLPLIFGAYNHDSIEDARQTYNDVMRRAVKVMNENQAFMATEIVYALTNDKGRNRAERAGEKYYKGIRETPYAPFVKAADRLANISFAARGDNEHGRRMKVIYKDELPHFTESIHVESNDLRFAVPDEMFREMGEYVG